MSTGFDLIPSLPIAAALVLGGAMPVHLAVLAAIPVLRRRTGWRMAVAGVLTLSLWLVAIPPIFSVSEPQETASVDNLAGLFIIASAWTAYLLLWGAITRGYSLGLLTTIYNAGRPLRMLDIELAYAGGRGLPFLMEKRVSGLILLRLIRRQGSGLSLTHPWGVLAARLSQFFACILGLSRTG